MLRRVSNPRCSLLTGTHRLFGAGGMPFSIRVLMLSVTTFRRDAIIFSASRATLGTFSHQSVRYTTEWTHPPCLVEGVRMLELFVARM